MRRISNSKVEFVVKKSMSNTVIDELDCDLHVCLKSVDSVLIPHLFSLFNL